MKIELTHYTELCFDGEVERTGVSVIDKNERVEFKTKGNTSMVLRECGLDLSCLKKSLNDFKDFMMAEDVCVVVDGELAVDNVEFHSPEWWVNRVDFWETMILENSEVVERIEKIAQKDWKNDERSDIRLSREAVKHAQGNLKVAESKIK
jgi:hypothetical protein